MKGLLMQVSVLLICLGKGAVFQRPRQATRLCAAASVKLLVVLCCFALGSVTLPATRAACIRLLCHPGVFIISMPGCLHG